MVYFSCFGSKVANSQKNNNKKTISLNNVRRNQNLLTNPGRQTNKGCSFSKIVYSVNLGVSFIVVTPQPAIFARREVNGPEGQTWRRCLAGTARDYAVICWTCLLIVLDYVIRNNFSLT